MTCSPCQIMVTFLIVFFAFYILSDYIEFRQVEGWTSPGTLVQVETSHVPTQEDVRMRQRERQRVHRDLLDLTGGLTGSA